MVLKDCVATLRAFLRLLHSVCITLFALRCVLLLCCEAGSSRRVRRANIYHFV